MNDINGGPKKKKSGWLLSILVDFGGHARLISVWLEDSFHVREREREREGLFL